MILIKLKDNQVVFVTRTCICLHTAVGLINSALQYKIAPPDMSSSVVSRLRSTNSNNREVLSPDEPE